MGALLAQPLTGWLIHHLGSGRLTRLMPWPFAAVLVLPGLAWDLPSLMVALFLVGAVNGMLDVAMNAQGAVVETRAGRSIMSGFHGLWSVGSLSGAILGSAASAIGLLPAVHLGLVAVCSLPLLLWAVAGLIDDRPDPLEPRGPALVLPPPSLIALGLLAFAVLFSEGAINDWSGVYLRDHHGCAGGWAATGFIAFQVLMALGRLCGDRLVTRLGGIQVVRISGALILLGMLLAVGSGSAWGAVAGFALVGAGVACVFPVVLSAAARTPGVAGGTAIAGVATMGYTGFLAGPPLIGSLAEVFSLGTALGVLGVAGLALMLLAGMVGPPVRAEVEPVSN